MSSETFQNNYKQEYEQEIYVQNMRSQYKLFHYRLQSYFSMKIVFLCDEKKSLQVR